MCCNNYFLLLATAEVATCLYKSNILKAYIQANFCSKTPTSCRLFWHHFGEKLYNWVLLLNATQTVRFIQASYASSPLDTLNQCEDAALLHGSSPSSQLALSICCSVAKPAFNTCMWHFSASLARLLSPPCVYPRSLFLGGPALSMLLEYSMLLESEGWQGGC